MKPSRSVKFMYGLGGTSQAGWDAAAGFVFFYYTAVLGLPGSLVGAAIFIGLCADAGVDPFIGSWSDNLRSRLGRRLPLMLVGTPLLALALGLLFSPPPGLAEPLLFLWLVVTGVAARSFLSLHQVPYVALGAEMADGYVERSSVVAYRTIVGIFTGVAITALAYSVYFTGEGGLQRPERYPGFGWSVAALIGIGMALSCLGVRRYAAALPQPTAVSSGMLRRLPGEVIEIFRNRSFRILFFSAVLAWAAIGLNVTLQAHVHVFVWKLRPELIQLIAYAYLAGVLLGVPLAGPVSKRLEKKAVVMLGIGALLIAWTFVPLAWAFAGFRPEGAAAVPVLAFNAFFAGIGVGFVSIAYPSMMADAADEHEHLFDRRREGLYFAGLSFAAKGAAGLGVLLAGVAIDLIGFPEDAGRQIGAVLPNDVLVGLVLGCGPAAALLGLVSLVLFISYSITRARHDQISQALRARRSGGDAAVAPG